MNEENIVSNGSNRKLIIAIVGVILALLISAAVFFSLMGSLNNNGNHINISAPSASTSSPIVYDNNVTEGGWDVLSEEEVQAALNNKVEEGLINISMNTSPYFKNGSSAGNLMIVNELVNNYPQKVQIYRNDTDELIYTSGAIPVGSKIETAKLDVVLPAGTYECTAMFHSLDPNTGNIVGSAGAIIVLTVRE